MRGWIAAAALLALSPMAATSASAQNLSLRGPAWAQTLLASDVIPTNGGRAMLADAGVTFAVRVTVAPTGGGVARVIRLEQRGAQTTMALRRFTGHPNTGWWLWGSDMPFITHPTNAQRDEIATLMRAAMGVSTALGGTAETYCASGEEAFVEMTNAERSISSTRICVDPAEPVGHLVTRLSELAGSRTDEELHDAATAELLAADQAFNAKAQADGVAAAFTHYAAEDAVMFNGATPVQGHDAVAALFHDWPANAHLTWTPQTARVSERGDMGWTWGRSVYVGADGARREGRYVTTWKRDYDGNWRFAFDAALRDPPPAAAPARAAPAATPAAH